MTRLDLKVALVSDQTTRDSLEPECRIYNLTPLNYGAVFKLAKPDLLLVESCWLGYHDRWRYKIASYPHHPKRTNKALARLVEAAKQRGLPTVFWNKEDNVHFERFINSARLFDHILTVDNNCQDRYRLSVDGDVDIQTFMFAVQPRYHFFKGFDFRYRQANFVGSYRHDIHPRRRFWQNMFFQAAAKTLGLTIVDRNSNRKSPIYRFPEIQGSELKPSLPYSATADIYRRYLVSLNINTIEDSPSMFSRRLIEILACGGLAVTNPSKSVKEHFSDFCHVINCQAEAEELFARLAKDGPSRDDLARAEAGARYVQNNFTWMKWLERLANTVLK